MPIDEIENKRTQTLVCFLDTKSKLISLIQNYQVG